MIRIGIVGSDNSHALAFAKLANIDRALGERCRVVGIWGADSAQAKSIAEEAQIERFVERPEALVDEVDLAVIVDRHGDLHAEHGLPFIERGMPVFIDKPFAIKLDDCRRMIDAARKSGSAVTSFSALRYAPAIEELAAALPELGAIKAAHFAGPCDFASPYGGPFFYATHVVEMALRLVGEDIESVRATRTGASVVVLVIWRSGAIGTFSLLGDAAYHFHATLFGATGMAAREILGGAHTYARTLEQIVHMAETGAVPLNEDQLLRPITIVHAIVESLEQGGSEVRLM
jgi:predicted dehydrogenase